MESFPSGGETFCAPDVWSSSFDIIQVETGLLNKSSRPTAEIEAGFTFENDARNYYFLSVCYIDESYPSLTEVGALLVQ